MAVQTPIPQITDAQAKVLFRIGRHRDPSSFNERWPLVELRNLWDSRLIEVTSGTVYRGGYEITELGKQALAKFEAAR